MFTEIYFWRPNCGKVLKTKSSENIDRKSQSDFLKIPKFLGAFVSTRKSALVGSESYTKYGKFIVDQNWLLNLGFYFKNHDRGHPIV